ncbi:unnamed protein product [Dovyalis caffra]|uniref:Uncharacterized protein n=1 Tax=Dovyalis caffra TaxID=77055 RepID=A0AAV1QZB2_9ROSI|nr:unnamed protein product [Dovyalis caffra]
MWESGVESRKFRPCAKWENVIRQCKLETFRQLLVRTDQASHWGSDTELLALFLDIVVVMSILHLRDLNSSPAFLIEIATPISGLVREMASGLVRIAVECDKEKGKEKKAERLLEEPMWRTYCNGKKCGLATRKECGPKQWKVLKAVEPISMGAGVLPRLFS